MEEFSRLKWDWNSDQTYLEKRACSFVSDEELMDSFVYKHLKKKLPKPKPASNKTKLTKFVPGRNYVAKFPRKSSLNKKQQEICFNAMKLLSQNKPNHQLTQGEVNNLEIFKSLNSKLNQENGIFNEFAKKAWDVNKQKIWLQNNIYQYAVICFRKKINRYFDYGDFYREVDTLSLMYKEEENTTVEVNCIKNSLELGTLARFSHPSLKLECRLSAQTLPDLESVIQVNSKLPVSQDANIRNLLNDNDIDIVISSSGLKRLLDNTNPKAKWLIPIKVEAIQVKRGEENIVKTVVFIDKPLPNTNPDSIDLKYFSMKRLVRSNFCQYEAFKFDKQDTFPDEKLAKINDKLTQLEGEVAQGSTKLKWKTKEKVRADKIHHNVNYRIWNWKKVVHNSTLMKNTNRNTEFNMLVRSKIDGCEISSSGALQPVIVKPKMELQLEYGANIPSKSELSREWTSLFFRPFSTLYRVRMHCSTAEVVHIEKCTIQKVMTEFNALYQYNPYLGLGMLDNLMNKLLKLKSGRYILIHDPKNENFVGLWQACDKSNGTFNLEMEQKNFCIDNKINKSWLPIDLNYILPINEFLKRPPGCLEPSAETFKKGGKQKPNSSKRNKSKTGQDKMKDC